MSKRNERTSASPDSPVTADAVPSDDLRSLGDVARRAYQKYQARGGEHGRDVEDWLEAERETVQRQKGTGDVEYGADQS